MATAKRPRKLSRRSAFKMISDINATLSRNSVFNITEMEQDSETFHGFVRVQMNLIRPVQMVVPAQPPTLYDVLKQDSASSQASPAAPPASPPASEATDDSQTTFFYLPKDTSKVIHINSDTTTKEVIRSLLSKFKIKDNPLKFALYHKEGLDEKTGTIHRTDDGLRRIGGIVLDSQSKGWELKSPK